MGQQQVQDPDDNPRGVGGESSSVFRYAAAAMLEVDVSRLGERLERLLSSGIRDVDRYLEEHPALLEMVAPLFTIVDANDAAVRLFETETRENLLGEFYKSFDWEDSRARGALEQVIGAIVSGDSVVESEFSALTFKRKKIKLKMGVFLPKGGDPFPNALVTLVDITRRVAAEERVRRLNRLYMILSDVNHAIARVDSENELFEEVCRACVGRKSFLTAWIGLVDETTGSVVAVAQAGWVEGYLDNLSISTREGPGSQGPTARAIREKTVIVCNDIEHDPLMTPWRENALKRGFRSSASVSFGSEGSTQGVLNAYAADVDLFGSDEVGLLKEIGSDLSFALRTFEAVRSRRRSEDALAYERNLLRTLIDHIPDGIFAMDRDRRLTLVNPADVKVYGSKSAEEVLGHTDAELFSPEIAANFEADNKAVIDEGRPIIDREEYYVDTEGKTRWLLTSKLPLKDREGSVVGLVGVGRDITDSREADRRLRQQAQLLDIASDAIVVRSMSGEVQFWNRGAETIFGWPREEAMGREIDTLIRAEKPEQLEEALTAVISEGSWTSEIVLIRRDETRILGEMRWNLVTGEVGPPESILMVVTDITERRSVEERLFRAHRLESLGTLASGIAHDLNNVLTPILVGIDALSPRIEDGMLQRILKVMRSSAQRGSEVVNQVVGFARGGEEEQTEIAVRPIVREIEEIVRATFPKAIRLRVSFPEDLWTILANRTQIHQVLMNLTVNARDAMEGQGTLTIYAENATLDEAYVRTNPEARAQSYVVISIEDTGAGMSPRTVERIFDPFFTTKGSGRGTGLGLSTCRTIVASHGGFINVESELDRGSTFQVYLPAAASPTRAGSPVPSEERPAGSGETILVVDDEAAVREITRQILKTHGYTVTSVEDGAEALVVFKEQHQRFALVLCDMDMPNLDGNATIQAIRKIAPETKIIAMSGLATRYGSSTVRPIGTAAFLPKPYTAAVLLQTIHRVLNNHA